MAIQILPPKGGLSQAIGTGLGTGLGSILEGLATQKAQEFQAQKSMQALQGLGLQPQQAQGISQLPPQLQQAALKETLKQFGAGQQMAQRSPRVGERVSNLLDINQTGSIDKTLGFFGGSDADTYDLYAKELQKDISKVYPDAVVPTSKMDAQARNEGLQRLKARLEQDFGPQQAEQIMESPVQQMGLPSVQQAEQQQQPQEEGGLAQVLRTLTGAGAEAAGPLAALGSPAAGAGIVGSDILQALESYRQPIHTEEEIEEAASRMAPEQAQKLREQYQAEKEAPFKLSDYLPTTKNIKSIVGRVLPDNYLEPRSKGEALVQDAVNKGVGLVSFGGMSIPKAIAGTAAGLTAREVAKNYGAGPLAQTAAELTFTMMPGIIYNNARDNLKNTARSLYEKFDESAASNQRIDAKDLQDKAKILRKNAEKFESLSSNKQLINTLENLEEEFVTGGKMKMADAVNAKKEIARTISESQLDPTAHGLLSKFNNQLKNTIYKKGAELDAEGFKHLKQADEIWSGLKSGESLVTTIKDLYNSGKYRSLSLYTLAGKFPGTAAGGVVGRFLPGVGFAKGAAVGALGQELVQTYKFLKNTPGAWEELAKAAKDSLRGNAKAGAARLAKIDKKALKYEEGQQRSQKQRVRRGL